jgi:anaerobic magnesium-protoporphyrin IX monomethyl ester cyclase
MHILFVHSLEFSLSRNGLISHPAFIQHGISYISSFLQNYGHQTDLVVLNRLFSHRKNEAIIDEYLNKFLPEVICFTAVTTQYSFIKNIAKYIKHHYPDIYLLAGGVHVTLNPEEALSDNFDAICIGEGEKPTYELVSQLENGRVPSGIPNIWMKHGLEIEKNPPREFLQNLDTLPSPDRKMWRKWKDKKSLNICSVLASRGCPFNCSYCCNHILRKTAPGSYVRHRSPRNIVDEIKGVLIELPEVKEIYLETETIASNIDWCLELCFELSNLNATLDQPLSFGANIRIAPNMDLENIFSALRKSNFRFVSMGLESGSERVRREILRRNYANGDIINAVKLARKFDLQICFFNLIGIPGESLDDFKETIKINRICKPDWHFTSIFFPYPGTDLYSLCKEQGFLKEPLDPRNERSRAVLDLPQFPKRKIQECYNFFKYYIYFGLNPEDRLKLTLINLLDRCLVGMPFLKYLIPRVKKYIFLKLLR